LRITPLDIYQQEFKRVLRGIDPDEVEEFLERVADDYEQAIKENNSLKERIKAMESLLTGEGKLDDITDSAKTREEADKIIEEAKKEFDDLIKEARKEANNIIGRAKDEAERTKSQAEMDMQKDSDSISDSGSETESEEIMNEAKTQAKEIIQAAKVEASRIRELAEKMNQQIDVDRDNTDLNGLASESAEGLDQLKEEELNVRRELSRLKGQKERFLIEYRELLERHLVTLTERSEE